MTSFKDKSHLVSHVSRLQNSREPFQKMGFQDLEEVETISIHETLRASQSTSPKASIPSNSAITI